MENLDDSIEKQEIGISEQAKRNLNAGSGWAKAVAIIGFVGAGFMLIGSIGAFIILPLIGLVYLILAAAYIYISYLLYSQAQAATANDFDLDKFAENFNKFWKSTVILMIVGFVLGIVLSFAMGAMASNGLQL
jgi:hypothetical protein